MLKSSVGLRESRDSYLLVYHYKGPPSHTGSNLHRRCVVMVHLCIKELNPIEPSLCLLNPLQTVYFLCSFICLIFPPASGKTNTQGNGLLCCVGHCVG